MRYYIVTAKCGHVGKGRYIPIPFAIRARSAAEAASIARRMPRVKHHHKDAIKNVQEIDKNRYIAIIKENQQDPYFHCHSIQEQRSYMEKDIYMEERLLAKTRESKRESDGAKKVFDGKQLIRKPKHYIRNYDYTEGAYQHGIY